MADRTDPITRKCVEFLCAIIQYAASDAKRELAARHFFEAKGSPFWDYCAHLGLNGDYIAQRVLSQECMPHQGHSALARNDTRHSRSYYYRHLEEERKRKRNAYRSKKTLDSVV